MQLLAPLSLVYEMHLSHVAFLANKRQTLNKLVRNCGLLCLSVTHSMTVECRIYLLYFTDKIKKLGKEEKLYFRKAIYIFRLMIEKQ